MFRETIVALFTMLNNGGVAKAPDPKPVADAVRVAQAPKLTADEVVDKVQKFYEKTNRSYAQFTQFYDNTTFGDQKKSKGKVYIKKPGKMRWDYYENVRGKKDAVLTKSFASDGKQLWAVEHDTKQIFEKILADDLLPVAVTFLYGKGDLKRDFDAALDPGKHGAQTGEYVIKLTPKKPSAQYKTLWLVVDGSTFQVRRSIVLEASNNTNAFTFIKPDLTKDVKDAWFFVDVKTYKAKGFRIVKDEEPTPE